MNVRFRTGMIAAALMTIAVPTPAIFAEEPRFEVGIRANIVAADGEPANDILGGGLYADYSLGDKWYVGLGVDLASFDLERPWKILGLQQDPVEDVVDAPTDSTTISGWIGRRYRKPDSRHEWFWTAGLGASSVDVEDVTGTTDAGNPFAIRTEVDTEMILSASGGYRKFIGKRWAFEASFRLDQHFADWKLTDSVSGEIGTVDDYLTKGLIVGFAARF